MVLESQDWTPTSLTQHSLVPPACITVAASPVVAGESKPAPAGQAQQAPDAGAPRPSGTPAPPGLIIYIDPQTGQFVKEPAPGTVPLQFSPQLQNALSTSDQGLVEEPSAVPGGGVKVNLQGRFRSPLFATTDANGKAKIQHLDEMPPRFVRPPSLGGGGFLGDVQQGGGSPRCPYLR